MGTNTGSWEENQRLVVYRLDELSKYHEDVKKGQAEMKKVIEFLRDEVDDIKHFIQEERDRRKRALTLVTTVAGMIGSTVALVVDQLIHYFTKTR